MNIVDVVKKNTCLGFGGLAASTLKTLSGHFSAKRKKITDRSDDAIMNATSDRGGVPGV
jgi:hypothetical protein